MPAPLRIVTLLARHGTDRYHDALDDLLALFARNLGVVDHQTVVIDTAEPRCVERRLRDRVELIGGCNRSWEFSAWNDGVRHLGRRLEDFDLVHVATSAFRELYVDYLDRIDEKVLRFAARRAAAVGHIDYYNEPVQLFGVTNQSWLRSAYLFLAPREVRLLGSFVARDDFGFCFTDDARSPFRPDSPLSPGLRQNILGWLTGAGTNQGVQWHSRFELAPDTFELFRAKTAAILNEQLLTVRLRATGCHPVDATWLAGRLAAGDFASDHRGPIAPWHLQLAERIANTSAATQ